jgi:hypothetical protein
VIGCASFFGVILTASASIMGAATPAGAPHVVFSPPEGAGPTVRWNVFARELIAGSKGESFQDFSILSVAQYRAASAEVASHEAAIVAASATVLTRLLPGAAARIAARRNADLASLRRTFQGSAGQFDASTKSGSLLGEALLKEPTSVAPKAHAVEAPPSSPLIWRPDKTTAPEGYQRQFLVPWFPAAVEAAIPPAPPAALSQEFQGALEAVRTAMTVRTPEQTETVRYWAGQERGEMTPGLWNGIADQVFSRDGAEESAQARRFALLNAAMHDAMIACFKAKYRYWLARPTQLDRKLVTPIHVPEFPAYPSAHACLSGAASEVLSTLVPEAKDRVVALANEATQSRVQAGLHYPFDGEAGLALGRKIADAVLLVPGRMLQP